MRGFAPNLSRIVRARRQAKVILFEPFGREPLRRQWERSVDRVVAASRRD